MIDSGLSLDRTLFILNNDKPNHSPYKGLNCTNFTYDLRTIETSCWLALIRRPNTNYNYSAFLVKCSENSWSSKYWSKVNWKVVLYLLELMRTHYVRSIYKVPLVYNFVLFILDSLPLNIIQLCRTHLASAKKASVQPYIFFFIFCKQTKNRY